MSYIRRPDGHVTQVVQTSLSTLEQIDGQFRVGLTVAYGTEPVKVYTGDTQEMAEAAAKAGLDKLTARMGGGQVIIDIDEI